MNPRFVRGLFVAVGFALSSMVVGMWALQEASNESHAVAETSIILGNQRAYDRCVSMNLFREDDQQEQRQQIRLKRDQLEELVNEPPFNPEDYPGYQNHDQALQTFIDEIDAAVALGNAA